MGGNFAPPADDGLMVAAPPRTLHETLGEIGSGPAVFGCPSTAASAQASITAQQAVTVRPDHHHHPYRSQLPTGVPTTLPGGPKLPQQMPPPALAFHPAALPLHAQVGLNWENENNHDTALTLACTGGHEDVVTLLLSRGALLEHPNKKGFTPLMAAATAGHTGTVNILLSHGAHLEAVSKRSKDTALSLACSEGCYEVVEFLLTRGA